MVGKRKPIPPYVKAKEYLDKAEAVITPGIKNREFERCLSWAWKFIFQLQAPLPHNVLAARFNELVKASRYEKRPRIAPRTGPFVPVVVKAPVAVARKPSPLPADLAPPSTAVCPVTGLPLIPCRAEPV